MNKVIKKWRTLCLTGIMLLFSMSMTVLATEPSGSSGEAPVLYEISLVGETEGYVYNGTAIMPEVESVLYNGTTLSDSEYTVKYAEDDTYVNAGEHTVYVTINENGDEESGEESSGEAVEASDADPIILEKTFIIEKASMENAKVSLSKDKYTYSGKERKPSVQVTLEGSVIPEDNYSVSYANNVEVGTATVTVAGVENLTGSINEEYKIVVGIPKVSTTPTYNKVKVSWKKVTGASGYMIYRSTSENGTYKRFSPVKDGDVLYYNDTGLTTGKVYYYKVRAYRTVNGKNIYSDYSTAKKQIVQPAKSTITKIDRVSPTSLKITWKKLTGSSGYAIYRSTSENGTYTRIGVAKGASKVTYTDTSCTCGRTYYYKIKAYRTQSGKNYYGASSVAMSKNTVPAKLVISNSTICENTSITLKWKKVSYATGYIVYRSTSKSSGYERIKTISKSSTLSWKDTGLEKNKIYYYKIRAYRTIDGKKVYGYCSDAYTKTKAGWKYTTYDGKKVKLYYNASGKLVKDVSNLIGKQSSYVIKVNKQRCTVTVYAKDGSNGYIIPVKSFICSPGYSTPTGTFYTPQKYRWHELMGPCWGQWCTRIHGGVLFHSVFYNSYNNNNTLSVSAYNKLGTICSHGCVRLTAGDAKWIYDNCKLKTKVIIYNSSNAGPLGKPSAHKLAYGHTWDPTDPNMKSKCKSRGCH